MKLREILQEKLTKTEQEHLVTSFDVVGDIAIIIIHPELQNKERLIGETILQLHKNINVVAKRAGVYSGEFRTIPLTIIAGVNRLNTEHKENGVRFILNPEQVYFSVRLATERLRIARLIQPKENVLVCFSGVGAFPLVIAANSEVGRVTGIEKNPVAHEFACRSLAFNKTINNVSLVLGDVTEQLPTLTTSFDRVLLPLPQSPFLYIDYALAVLKQNGMLHLYSLQKEGTFDEAVAELDAACTRNNRKLTRSESVVCGHCGTRLYRICLDAKIE